VNFLYFQTVNFQGSLHYGKTQWETLESTKHLALQKQVDELPWQNNNRVAEDVMPSAESVNELNAEEPAPEEPNSEEINLTTKTKF
jgi:hypothetical protein